MTLKQVNLWSHTGKTWARTPDPCIQAKSLIMTCIAATPTLWSQWLNAKTIIITCTVMKTLVSYANALSNVSTCSRKNLLNWEIITIHNESCPSENCSKIQKCRACCAQPQMLNHEICTKLFSLCILNWLYAIWYILFSVAESIMTCY